jgi:hypothetical protein
MSSQRLLTVGVTLAVTMCCMVYGQDQLSSELQNGGFEQPSISGGAELNANPETWFHFSSATEQKIGITDAKKKAGSQSAFFKCQTAADVFEGLAQKISVEPGRHYIFTVYILNNPEDPLTGDAFGQISLEWQNGSGKEVNRTHGPVWNFESSSSRWEKYLVEYDAPADATTASLVITIFSKNSAGAGSFYADDAELGSKAGGAAE